MQKYHKTLLTPPLSGEYFQHTAPLYNEILTTLDMNSWSHLSKAFLVYYEKIRLNISHTSIIIS